MKIGNILHVHVDKFSQGNVYIKCQSPQVANAVIESFSGRRYAGGWSTNTFMILKWVEFYCLYTNQ